MSDAQTVVARIGYWFRMSVGLKRLHVAKWQRMGDGSLLIVAACNAQVVDPTAPEPPRGLILQPTAVDALMMMDGNQSRHLCSDCRTIFTKRA